MYTEWVTGKLVYFDHSHPDKFLLIYLKYIPLKIQTIFYQLYMYQRVSTQSVIMRLIIEPNLR